MVGTQEYVRFPFTTNFAYNGTNNMLVDWSFDSKTGAGWSTSGATRTRAYFNGGNASSVTAAGTDTGGNWQVRLIFNAGPALQATAVAGTALAVLATDTGPSAAGRGIGTFTISNTSATVAQTLNSLSLAASGTGNDSNAYSEVGIFEDTNSSTVYDTGDVRYGTAAVAYPTDNGTLTFTAAAAFAASQTRRYFVVAKLNGGTLGTNGQTFNTQVSAMSVTGGSASGTPSTVMNGLTITAPTLTVAPIAAAAQSVLANSTGTGGIGISAASFTITCNAVGTGNLASITITASGTGNDSTAYTEVGIFEDTNTSGAYDAADTRYGTLSTAFPSDNGAISFTTAQVFNASTNRRYFVVVKLDGATLPTPSQTFNFQVSAMAVTGTTSAAGVPSSVMTGLIIQAPAFSFADASAAAAATAYASSGDFVMQEFTATYAAGPNNSLTGVTLTAGGSGNDASGYASVRLVRDANANGTYEPASDTQVATMAAFAADNGTVTFTLSDAFTAGLTHTYFVVSAYNASVTAGNTFQCRVSGAAYGYTGTTSTGIPAPASLTAGLVIAAPSFTFADLSPAAQATAFLGGTDYVIQSMSVTYSAGPANTLTGITLTASGTGNDLTNYASVALFRDSNINGTYDVGTDTQVNSQAAFSADNGTLTFVLAGAEAAFTSGQAKRYFVVVAFNLTGANNTTFSTQITSASGGTAGATYPGLPAPAGGPTPGLNLLANSLIVTFNGPGAAVSVNNNDQGAGGNGRVLLDFTLQTISAAWAVSSLTFTASGTANHQTAYSYLALFEDSNANGVFNGPTGGDTLSTAAAAVSFGGTNTYTAALTNTAFPAPTTRRFFLVGRLAGTAIAGQTLNAQLTGQTSTPPAGGLVSGIPTATSTALIIDVAAVSVANSTTAPAAATREGGVAFSHTLGRFRLTATNNNATVNAFTLTTSGTGSWTTDVAATGGVQVYSDNGNGIYDGSPTDTLLFSGAGATPSIVCTFTSALNIANGATADLWLRTSFVATAGASVPETFAASIANAADVNVTGATPLLGTPAPTTNTLGIVIFFVTTFAPSFDLQTGGAAITITGSGFLAPLSLTIGGVVCPGVGIIGAGGTQITGFTVPAGTGQGKVLILTNGSLGPKTLTQTFDYAGGATIGGGASGGGGGGGGCVAGQSNAIGLLGLAALLVMILALRVAKRQVG